MLIVNPLNESSLVFPVLEYAHILGFTCAVGAMALVYFRLLGVGLIQRSTGQLWKDTMGWTLGALSLVIFSGLLLFSVNPDVYYLNYTFLLKMSFLALALLFHYTIVRKATGWNAPSAKTRTVGSIALTLWAVVLFGGVFIGLSASRPPASASAPAGIDFDGFLHR
jgi:hypothetical protein